MKKQLILVALLFSVIIGNAQLQTVADLRVDKSITMKGVRVTDISIDSSGSSKSNAKLVTEKAAKNYADSLATRISTIQKNNASVFEDRKPMLDLKYKGAGYARGWIDGQFMIVHNDTVRFAGGWITGNTIYDTIYRTNDEGATWVAENFFLPYPVHTVAHTQGKDGYFYMIGGDAFTTITQRRTVSRTNNGGRTWQLMTNNAPFSSILGSTFMDDYGTLYFGGGQQDAAGTLCDTLWKSVDGGTTWAIAATGMTILAGNTSNLLKYNNGRCIISTGGVYNPPSSTFSKKTYSFEPSNPRAWVEHDDLPSASGLHYANTIIYDEKYFVIQGANSSNVNTNGIYYLDKNFKWHTFINYTDNTKANLLPISHANGIGVFRNKIIIGVGNDFNATYTLEPSSFQTYTNFRDSLKFGNLSHLSQIENSYATLIGNNVKAGVGNNTIRRIDPLNEGSYYHQSPAGNFWGRLSTGYPVNIDASDTDGLQMKLNSGGELLLTSNNSFDAGSYKFQVDGNTYFSGAINAPNYAGNNYIAYFDASGNLNNGNTLQYNSNRLSIGGTSGLVYPPSFGISSLSNAAGINHGIGFTTTDPSSYAFNIFAQNTSDYIGFGFHNSGVSGNYAGTSLALASSSQFQSGSSNNRNLVFSSGTLIHNVGVSSTNTGLRSDATGLSVKTNATVHTANTFKFEVEGTSFLNGNVTIPGTVSNTINWAAANGTPSNTTTAVGWVRISINGVAAWLPYYQ